MARTQTDIQKSLLRNLTARGVVGHTGKGSVIKEIMGSNAFQYAEMEVRQDRLERDVHIDLAEGIALDLHAKDVFLTRHTPKRAYSRSNEQNVRIFTVNGLTFDNLDGGAPSFQVGSRLYTDEGLIYRVTGVPSLIGQTEAYISIQAVNLGSGSNIAQYKITRHGFDTYASVVKVENRYAINNGFNKEPDTSLRRRIGIQIQSLSKCNDAALSQSISNYGEIGIAQIINNYGGAGNIGIIVQPRLGILLSEPVLRGFSKSLSNEIAAGSTLVVKNPEVKYVSLETVIRVSEVLNLTEKQILINRIRKKLIAIFDGLQINENLNLGTLVNSIYSTDSRITAVGNNPDVIDIVRYKIIDGFATYETILESTDTVISVEIDEVILLDSSSPITLSIV